MLWRWALQSPAGLTVSTLRSAFDRELDYQRNEPAVLTLALDHDTADAERLYQQLENGIPIIRGWRLEPQPDTSTLAVIRFAGHVLGLDESTSEAIAVTAVAPPGRLAYRITAEIDDHPFEDGGEIFRQLVEDQNLIDATGAVMGVVEATVPRDLTYENREVHEAIGELTEFQDGPDYDVAPVAAGAVLGTVNVYRQMGVDRTAPGASVGFGYGRGTVGNCVDARRRWLPPRNRVRVIGDDSVTREKSDAGSIAKFGTFASTDQLADTVDAGVLDARAQELLAPGWRRLVEVDPDPRKTDRQGNLITPRPWLDYWLGDVVQVAVRKGAWNRVDAARIDGVKIAVGDDGLEDSHELAYADTEQETS